MKNLFVLYEKFISSLLQEHEYFGTIFGALINKSCPNNQTQWDQQGKKNVVEKI